MRDTGQEWRVIDELTPWDNAWFQKPPASVRAAARRLFDRRIVVDQYRRVLFATDADHEQMRDAA
jgi:hypothetical protein